jgi:hypothetical protein
MVPVTEPSGGHFIEVCYGNVCDNSDEFEIKAFKGVSTVQSKLEQAQTLQIRWPSGVPMAASGKVKVELYDDDPWWQVWNSDDKQTTISTSTMNDGVLDWTVDGKHPPADNYYIKVCHVGTAYCVESSTFEVLAISGSLDVTKPVIIRTQCQLEWPSVSAFLCAHGDLHANSLYRSSPNPSTSQGVFVLCSNATVQIGARNGAVQIGARNATERCKSELVARRSIYATLGRQPPTLVWLLGVPLLGSMAFQVAC